MRRTAMMHVLQRHFVLFLLCTTGILFFMTSVLVHMSRPRNPFANQTACELIRLPPSSSAQSTSRKQIHIAYPREAAAEANPSRIPLAERAQRICTTFPNIYEHRHNLKSTTAGDMLQEIYRTHNHLLLATNPANGRRLLYCSIPKVGNTSLKTFLLGLDKRHIGKYTDDSLHFYIRTVMGLPRLLNQKRVNASTIDETFKVMFVRHPFERLVSFFLDKGRRNTKTGNHFYHTYWNKAMSKARGGKVDTKKDVIKFSEFVDIILTTEPATYDLHWQLYSDRCKPCRVNYNFIGTLDDLHKMHELIGAKYERNLWKNKGPSNTNNATLVLFSQLPKSTVMELYRIYYPDFLMFGFPIDDYLSVAKSE